MFDAAVVVAAGVVLRVGCDDSAWCLGHEQREHRHLVVDSVHVGPAVSATAHDG